MLAGSAGRARRQSTVEPAPSPGVSSKKEHLAGIISEVVDCHKTMSIINEVRLLPEALISIIKR